MVSATQGPVLRHLLLDMISSRRAIAPERFAALTDQDWAQLSSMAAQHRLGPMLWQRGKDAAPPWSVPNAVSAGWQRDFRRSAFRSLAARRTLSVIDGLLAGANVRYAALKGAYLAPFAYSHPALRPLRDIDILVEPSRALEMFDLFQQHGFARADGGLADAANPAYPHKHLPGLFIHGPSPDMGFQVEIHTRITPGVPAEPVPGSLHDVAGLLDRAQRFDGISFLSPTDTLLHLIVHSVEDHEFNNGPLVMNDVAALLGTAAIDWPRFWTMVDADGWRPGAIMVLDLAAAYHSLPMAERPADAVSGPGKDLLDRAALLSLQDFESRGSVLLQADLAEANGVLGQLAILLRRAFPPLTTLSAYAGEPRTSWWSLLRYPDWLWTRGRERLLGKVSDDVGRARLVREWIRKDVGRPMG
jgi:hypothetical protein